MEPNDYLMTLRKRWVLIIALGLLGAVAAYIYASTLPTLYRSTSSVFVASQRGDTTTELVQGSTFTQDQVQSYAQLAPTPSVLEPVVSRLNLDTTARDLAGSVTADIRLNTVIIDITVSNRSPEQAAAIANAVTASLADVAEALSPKGADNRSAITMTNVSSARVAEAPYSPNKRFLVASGLLGGLILAVGYAFAREALDTRVRTEKDLERVSAVPVLGTVARRKNADVGTIVMRSAPYSPAAEDFRRLATNLEFADVDIPIRSVVVSSALPGEGKSTSAVNLALAMAERLQRVLLIDADLRKPSLAEYCQIDGAVGLTTVLVGNIAIEDAVRPWAGGIIDVLPSGVVPANPSQMLGSDAMAALMDNLISRYDFIVVDSPPLLPVTDPLTLAKLTDGAIVVARYKSTKRQQLSQSLSSLEAVSARVLGLVLNGVKPSGRDAYYGYQAEAVLEADSTGDDPAQEPDVELGGGGVSPAAGQATVVPTEHVDQLPSESPLVDSEPTSVDRAAAQHLADQPRTPRTQRRLESGGSRSPRPSS